MDKNKKKFLTITGVIYLHFLLFLIPALLLSRFLLSGVEDLYMDFGGELPAVTRHMINFSDFCSSSWYLTVPLLMSVVAVVSVVIGHFFREVDTKILPLLLVPAYLCIFPMLILAFLVFYGVVIYTPIRDLASLSL